MTTGGRFWLLRDASTAHKHGTGAITRRQHDRLADMVAFARADGPPQQTSDGKYRPVIPLA
ncbi:hypothetical protein [Promicromonospora soli]